MVDYDVGTDLRPQLQNDENNTDNNAIDFNLSEDKESILIIRLSLC